MKKHAFLVIAHNQPDAVCALAETLKTASSEVFVHIDRKSECNFDGLTPTAHVIRTRNVYWGGFGMVQATLDLLSKASTLQKFATYTLLSGSDFPIKPMKEVLRTLDSTTVSRIDYCHDKNPRWHSRYWRYYFIEVPGLPRRLLDECSRWLAKILPKRKFYGEMQPCFGSQWWTMTAQGVEAVLLFTKENPDFLKFCKSVQIPDEMFFQTIVLNALGENHVTGETLRYVDWSENTGKPKILTESDEWTLCSSDALFARKFDAIKSKEILRIFRERIKSS